MLKHVPSEIRVGPTRYAIKRSPIPEGHNRWAETDHINHEIRFGVAAHPKQMANTFWHELLHAIWENYGLHDLTADDERIVSSLAHGLVQVGQDLGIFPDEIKIEGEP